MSTKKKLKKNININSNNNNNNNNSVMSSLQILNTLNKMTENEKREIIESALECGKTMLRTLDDILTIAKVCCCCCCT